MSIKSAWPVNANVYRAASRGKVFTRQERIHLIENKKTNDSCLALIQEEREKIKTEKRVRNQNFKILHAMADHPDQKIKRTKDGGAYFQRRIAGKFQPREVVA